MTAQNISRPIIIMFGLLVVSATSLGCGDGMLGWSLGGDDAERVQQAHDDNGRYAPPESVAESGRQQAGNISYDDADRCIGTGTPILDGTDRLARFLRDNFSGANRYDSTVYCRPVRGGSSLSMHATGRAIDLYIPTIGDEADNAAGDPVANYLIQNATTLGVQYFIWDKTQFNTSRGYTEDYCSGRCWEHGGGKHPHHDHLHIELSKHSANNLSVAAIPAVGASGGSDASGGESPAVTPDAPDTVSPGDGDVVWSDEVTMSVAQVSGASRYEFDIQRYDGNQWTRYYTYETGRSSKSFWPATKDAYRWRVKVTTRGGTSDYSTWSKFWYRMSAATDTGSTGTSGGSSSTDNSSTTPDTTAPTGAWPSGSAHIYQSSVTLQVDQVSSASEYEFDIEVYRSSQWTDYYTYEPDVSSKAFWPYHSDTPYRWRARARTDAGWTDYTDWNVFLFGNASEPGTAASSAPPESNAPVGLSPTAGERIYTDSVTLTCGAVAGAGTYEFDIQYHDGQIWRDYYTYEPDTAAKTFWPYVEDTAHRFRVRAYTSAGWTDYSAWSVFLYGNASTP
jgi:hypothetical protein